MTDRQIFRNDFVNNACGRKFSQNMMFVRDGKVRDGFYYLEAFISKKLIWTTAIEDFSRHVRRILLEI